MSESLLMLKKYPYMVSSDNDSRWKGYLKMKNYEMFVSIICPEYPSLNNMEISSVDGLQVFLSDMKSEIDEIRLMCSSLSEFLDRFCEFAVEKTARFHILDESFDITEIDQFCDKYMQILSEIDTEIGTGHVNDLTQDLRCIILSVSDDQDVVHTMSLEIPENYPTNAPVITEIDLPIVYVNSIQQVKTVSGMFKKFSSAVSGLQQFWILYKSLYSSCTVVDPEVPKYADTCCKIALGKGVLLMLTLNPLDPFSCPELNLLGPEESVAPFRSTIENNLKDISWEPQMDIVSNLLHMLGLEEFPCIALSSADDSNNSSQLNRLGVGECSICFMLKTENDCMLPIKLCTNANCKTYFHTYCLAQWFLSIPLNEPSFDIITGPCPNCTKKIACPLKM